MGRWRPPNPRASGPLARHLGRASRAASSTPEPTLDPRAICSAPARSSRSPVNLPLLLKPSLHVFRQVPLRLVPPIEVGDAEHAKLPRPHLEPFGGLLRDRKSTRLNSSHITISYAVFCLKKKKKKKNKKHITTKI